LLKIQAAQDACQFLCQKGKSTEADVVILAIQKKTLHMTQASLKEILSQAQELTSEEKHALQGRIMQNLTRKQEEFQKVIENCLTPKRKSITIDNIRVEFCPKHKENTSTIGWYIGYLIDDVRVPPGDVCQKICALIHVSRSIEDILECGCACPWSH